MAQSVEDLIRIQLEISRGFEWGDPRSKVPDTPENRETWKRIARDLAAMEAQGIMPDLPREIPDLN